MRGETHRTPVADMGRVKFIQMGLIDDPLAVATLGLRTDPDECTMPLYVFVVTTVDRDGTDRTTDYAVPAAVLAQLQAQIMVMVERMNDHESEHFANEANDIYRRITGSDGSPVSG